MKIYISEKDMPKSCIEFKCIGCKFIEHISATQKVCKLTGTHGHGNNGDCPLRSLEQLKQEVRREFAEKVKDNIPLAMSECYVKTQIDNLLKQYEVEE